MVDAVDTVSAKVELITQAKKSGVRVISAMGAGNKLDPSAFTVADIHATKVCPLARAVRTSLKKRGITSVKCVYSEEMPISSRSCDELTHGGRPVPGSVSFVPPGMGYIRTGEVIKDLIN